MFDDLGIRLATIPEPFMLALGALGFTGLAARCWRRKLCGTA